MFPAHYHIPTHYLPLEHLWRRGIYITSTNYYRYYVNSHLRILSTFRGKVDIGATNDVVRIKGFRLNFDTNGFEESIGG